MFLVGSCGRMIPSKSLPPRTIKHHTSGSDVEVAHMNPDSEHRLSGILDEEVSSTVNLTENKLEVIRKISRESKRSDSGFESSDLPRYQTGSGQTSASQRLALDPEKDEKTTSRRQKERSDSPSGRHRQQHRLRKGRGKRLSLRRKGKKIIEKLRNFSMHTATLDEEAYAADSSDESDPEYRHAVYRPTHRDPPLVTSRPESTLHVRAGQQTNGDTYIDPSAIDSIPETSHRMEELKHHNHPGYLTHPQLTAAHLTSSVSRTSNSDYMKDVLVESADMTRDGVQDDDLPQLNVPLEGSGRDDTEIYDISNDAVGLTPSGDPGLQDPDIEDEMRANRVGHEISAVAYLHLPPKITDELQQEDDDNDLTYNQLGSLEGDDLDEILRTNLDQLGYESDDAAVEIDRIVQEQRRLATPSPQIERASGSRMSESPVGGQKSSPVIQTDKACKEAAKSGCLQEGGEKHQGEGQESLPKPNRRRISQLYLTLIDSSRSTQKTDDCPSPEEHLVSVLPYLKPRLTYL